MAGAVIVPAVAALVEHGEDAAPGALVADGDAAVPGADAGAHAVEHVAVMGAGAVKIREQVDLIGDVADLLMGVFYIQHAGVDGLVLLPYGV